MERKSLKERVSWLVNTSLADMKSGLWGYSAKNPEDVEVIKRGLASYKRRGSKTGVLILTAKLKAMKKEAGVK
jgi:hypothetical protein